MSRIKVQRPCSGFVQLLPFVVFISLFLGSMIVYSGKTSPIFACLVAVIVSFFTFLKSTTLDEKIHVFVEGSARHSVITICYIFILTSAFSYVLKVTGGIEAVINVSLFWLPQAFLLPGFFLIVSLFATSIGSSLGAIAAFLPLGLILASKINIYVPLMVGIVVCGAMLGDNLSFISDTTIAATQSVGAKMTDKFKENIYLALPALVLTVLVLGVINYMFLNVNASSVVSTVTLKDYSFLLPYSAIFLLTLCGINVLAVMVFALFVSLGLGVYFSNFSLFEGTRLLFDGFINNEGGIVEMVVYVLAKSGLSHVVEHNGGIDYIVNKFNQRIASRPMAEVVIGLLTFLVNMAVAVAAVSILIVGPVAKKLSVKFGVSPKRAACLLDVFSSISQSFLPYGAPLILASTLSGVSPITIVPFLFYQFFLLIAVLYSFVAKFKQDKDSKEVFASVRHHDENEQRNIIQQPKM